MKIPVLCVCGAKTEVNQIPDFLKIPKKSHFSHTLKNGLLLKRR